MCRHHIDTEFHSEIFLNFSHTIYKKNQPQHQIRWKKRLYVRWGRLRGIFNTISLLSPALSHTHTTHTDPKSPEDKPLYWGSGGHLWLAGVTQQTVNTRGYVCVFHVCVALWFCATVCWMKPFVLMREHVNACDCGYNRECVLSYLVVWDLRRQGLSQHYCGQVGPTTSCVSQVITSWREGWRDAQIFRGKLQLARRTRKVSQIEHQ